jgi:hypothetical protein
MTDFDRGNTRPQHLVGVHHDHPHSCNSRHPPSTHPAQSIIINCQAIHLREDDDVVVPPPPPLPWMPLFAHATSHPTRVVHHTGRCCASHPPLRGLLTSPCLDSASHQRSHRCTPLHPQGIPPDLHCPDRGTTIMAMDLSPNDVVRTIPSSSPG